MARILAISSQTVHGPVGNSASVPGLEWLGHTVLALPTIVLSHHPGHGRPAVVRLSADDLAAMFNSLEAVGALARCEGVITGYFAAAEQVQAVARALRRMKDRSPSLVYFCDPIIGDDPDGLYVPLPVAEAVRGRLLPLADFAAPNRFELEWLSGRPVTSVSSALDAARRLSSREVLATSIPASEGMIATLAVAAATSHEHLSVVKAQVPHGTGDLLSGLYFASRLNEQSPRQALDMAMTSLNRVIAVSAGSAALDLAQGLGAPRAS